MSFEENVKDIRKIYSIVFDGKDVDVHLTYKGNSYGVSKPWLLRIENREVSHANHEEAAEELLLNLKKELSAKIISTERIVSDYRKALGTFDN